MPTTRSKSCYLPFPPKTSPPVITCPNHRRHSRLAHTSATLIITLLHFAPHHPRLYAPYQPRPSSGSSRPPCYHRFREIIISLSRSYLSVLKRKERREEEEGYSDPNVMHACICILLFFGCFCALDKRLPAFCLIISLYRRCLLPPAMAHGSFVGRAGRKKEERPLLRAEEETCTAYPFTRRENAIIFEGTLWCPVRRKLSVIFVYGGCPRCGLEGGVEMN